MTLLATLGPVELQALRPVMIIRAKQDGNGGKKCRYGIRNSEDALESAIKIDMCWGRKLGRQPDRGTLQQSPNQNIFLKYKSQA